MEVSHPRGGDGADGELVTCRHEVDREHTLRLYAVTPADAGTYVCTAQSQLGTAAATARLRVEGRWWDLHGLHHYGHPGPSGGPCKGIRLTGSI